MLFLLVPALNISGLNTSQIQDRMTEIGIRRAFGAPRGTLFKQIFVENLMLMLPGGLVGLFFSFVLHLPILDCVTALLVSCYIIRSSFKIFMESNIELMDGVKDTSVYQKIFDAIDGVDGISNPHRVRSRSIGGKYMITLDVEADGNMTLSQAHTLANEIEQNIRQRIPEVYDIVVHIEPFGTHPENVFGVKETTSTKNQHK